MSRNEDTEVNRRENCKEPILTRLEEQGMHECTINGCVSRIAVVYIADTLEKEKRIPACREHAESFGRADCMVSSVEVSDCA